MVDTTWDESDIEITHGSAVGQIVGKAWLRKALTDPGTLRTCTQTGINVRPRAQLYRCCRVPYDYDAIR